MSKEDNEQKIFKYSFSDNSFVALSALKTVIEEQNLQTISD